MTEASPRRRRPGRLGYLVAVPAAVTGFGVIGMAIAVVTYLRHQRARALLMSHPDVQSLSRSRSTRRWWDGPDGSHLLKPRLAARET